MAYFNVAHLVRRGSVFCFRMAVPRTMWGRFGLREIKGSLKTGDHFTARMPPSSSIECATAYCGLVSRIAVS